MSRGFARALIAVVALSNAALFIGYQSADWTTYWTDQNGYLVLGEALSKTGRFTRYAFHPQFIPEVIRTPGYPLFVAAVNLTLGPGHLQVAIAQAFVFAAICLLASGMARLLAGDRAALAAGLVCALYPTFPYFAALTLSDLFTTLLVTLGLYAWLRAIREGRRWIVAAGVAFAAAAVTRPSFQYLPVALLLFAGVITPRSRVVITRAALMLAVAVAAVAPWMLYILVNFHTVSLSPPAAGIGRNLWEGHWQIAFPGRVQTTLTQLAETTWDRPTLDRRVEEYAGSVALDPAPMLDYVHQWQDMRRMWDTPKEPVARAAARVAADAEYGRLALEDIRRDPIRHLRGRLTRGAALLWVTEIPVRYSDINRLPVIVIRGLWLAQGLLMVMAAVGIASLWGRWRAEAAVFVGVFVYLTAVHVVLYSEARYTLPARPAMLVLAVIGVQATALSVTHRGWRGRFKRTTQSLGSGRPMA
jgi:4-amino-4-deoxy-L-arabinose transferase-like glycosyltransferase